MIIWTVYLTYSAKSARNIWIVEYTAKGKGPPSGRILVSTSTEPLRERKKVVEYVTLKNPRVIAENVEHFTFYESKKARPPRPIRARTPRPIGLISR